MTAPNAPAALGTLLPRGNGPALLRAFRSDELRDLTRLALHQGWDVYRRSGGHVSAVNPSTGAQVVLSVTGYVTGHTLASKRHEFARAGLDLRSKAERRRLRQEATTVHVRNVDPAEVTALGTRAPQVRPNAHQSQGGKYAMRGPQEVLDVGGYRVVIGERADDTWIGYTRDLGLRARRRTWYSGEGRQALLDRITADVAERPPVVAEAPAPEPEATESEWPGLAEHLDPDVDQAPASNRPSSIHVVMAEAQEYPLASALDALEATVAPAMAALEAAGRQDVADLMRAELAPRTPVEEELVRLYRRVMRGE